MNQEFKDRIRPLVLPLSLLAILASIVVIATLLATPKEPDYASASGTVPTAAAVPASPASPPVSRPSLPAYTVLEQKDISTWKLQKEREKDRSRLTARITYPTVSSSSANERADVAHQAALDIQRKTGADMVEVFLDLSAETSGAIPALAIVRYSPDGKGMSGSDNYHWEVEAAEGTFTPQQVKIANLFFAAYKRDPNASESTITAAISRTLHVPKSKVIWPAYVSSQLYSN
ncbi:MAG TPA: hypothetical protein VI756_13950 [Blastocatellia bacterium]